MIKAFGGVYGALIELEKWVPGAGLAMSMAYLPRGLAYEDDSVRDNGHKWSWSRASRTRKTRYSES